ncbi:adhesin [Mycoplasmoides genitalium]
MEYHNLIKVVKESLEVEATSTFNPTQGLKKDSPVKDSNKDSEKLERIIHEWGYIHSQGPQGGGGERHQVTASAKTTLLKSHWNIRTVVGQMWSWMRVGIFPKARPENHCWLLIK